MRTISIAALVAAVILGMPLLPVLAQDHDRATQPPATAMAQMPMGDMMGMMKECESRHQAMSGALDEMLKTIDEAQASKDAAKLQAALTQVKTRLTGMREQMKMSNDMMMMMMQHMMSMPGRGGMMNPPAAK